jgi:hypothetical protein
MPDRELLEAAAKAAGLVAHRYCEPWKAMAQYTLHDGYFGPSWNPLTDDGDALRLAVRLGIHITNSGIDAWASTLSTDAIEPLGGNPYAATRRAIVRAAAAMHAKTQEGEQG